MSGFTKVIFKLNQNESKCLYRNRMHNKVDKFIKQKQVYYIIKTHKDDTI